MNTKHVGAQSELLAAAWLLANGYEVYRNVSQHGLIDIVGMKDGVVEFFDVKTIAHVRSQPPYISEEMARIGIKILVVRGDGSCEIAPALSRPVFNCKTCGREYLPSKSKQLYCSAACRRPSPAQVREAEVRKAQITGATP